MVHFVVKQIFSSRHRRQPQRFVTHAASMLAVVPGVEVAAVDDGLEVHGVDEKALREAVARCYQRFPTEFTASPVSVLTEAISGAQPMMCAEFTVPWRCSRELSRRLEQRGVTIDNYETVEGVIHLYARGAMESFLGVETDVAEVAAGEGSVALRFSHYDPVAACSEARG
ncbi:MAG: hypothetical protein RBS88_04730 [Spongiibacteraceae bacterium]|jgi:translation elongation factor EF-G|nr:hypothetical protein [Spongiibacteraceae bacterium]